MNLTAPTDPRALRRVLSCYPGGVTAICGLGDDGKPCGMAANSFTSVSLDPPLVAVCIQNTSRTWPDLRGLPRLGISVLSAGQDAACRALAARDGDRFAGVNWHATDTGAVLITDAAAWFECSMVDEMPAGDHHIVLLRVETIAGEPSQPPLVFHASHFKDLTEHHHQPAHEPN